MNKVIIKELPDMKEIPGVKRWKEERGEFVQVAYQEAFRHLAVFEIRKGYTRGAIIMRRKRKYFMFFEEK